jgi:transposase
MGKPYSVDLRRRVVAAIEAGMSRNQAAKQFGVVISTAIGWMQQTGSVAPGQMGGHKGSVQTLSHIHSCDGFGFR